LLKKGNLMEVMWKRNPGPILTAAATRGSKNHDPDHFDLSRLPYRAELHKPLAAERVSVYGSVHEKSKTVFHAKGATMHKPWVKRIVGNAGGPPGQPWPAKLVAEWLATTEAEYIPPLEWLRSRRKK
jgi:hypothetical protein